MSDEVYLTRKGYEEKQARLNELISKGRNEIAEKIRIAREFGDLSENAEYESAKEEQGHMEKEIMETELLLRTAIIINEDELDTSKISVGNTVKLYDKTYEEELTLRIVGATEANLSDDHIANDSPLGKALLGKTRHEIATVKTPTGGTVEFEILDIMA